MKENYNAANVVLCVLLLITHSYYY